MDIKKLLKKMAQMADFQQSPVEPVIDVPVGQVQDAQPGVVDEGVAQTGPLAPIQEAPTMIQSDVAEWHPSRGRNKGQTYYYLQLTNVVGDEIGAYLTSLGYKFNAKFGSWSKQAKQDNVLGINAELDGLEQKFRVAVGREAVQKLQEIFGFTSETSTEMGGDDTSEDIKKSSS